MHTLSSLTAPRAPADQIPRCPRCASTLPSGPSPVNCTRCAATVDLDTLSHIEALSQLAADIARRPGLPDVLRVDLIGRLTEAYREAWSRVVRSSVKAEPTTVAPGAVEPQPPTETDSPTEVARPAERPLARAVPAAVRPAPKAPFGSIAPPPTRTDQSAAEQREPAPTASAPVPRPARPQTPPRPQPAHLDRDASDQRGLATDAPRAPLLPDWLRRLGPAAAENLMFVLGGFLVAAGAVYFASTAWTTMGGASRLLVLEGGLMSLAGLLLGYGRLLTKGFSNHPDGRRIRRTTAHIAAGLAPIGAVIAGRLALANPLLGLAAGGAVLGSSWLVHRRLIGPDTDPPHRALALAAAAGGVAFGSGPLVGIAVVGLLLAIGWRRQLTTNTSGAIHLLASGLALVAHGAVVAGEPALPGAALAALALTSTTWTHGRALGWLAVAASLTGVAAAGTSPILLPIAALLSTLTIARITLRHDIWRLWMLALVGSLVAYVTAPGAMATIVEAAKRAFAAEMGYGSQPVPLAWYGLTCLPYIIGLAIAAWRLERTDRRLMGALSRVWLLLVALSLCALATLSSDPRAPMAVLGAEGATLLVIGIALRWRPLVALGPVVLAAGWAVGGHWLGLGEKDLLASIIGALAAIALIATPLTRPRDLHRTLWWACGAPAVAVGLVLTLAVGHVPNAYPTAGAIGAWLVLAGVLGARARFSGGAWWTIGAQLFVTSAAVFGLRGADSMLLPAIPAAIAAAAALLHVAARRRPRQARRWGAHAVLLGGVLVAAVFSSPDHPHPAYVIAAGLLAVSWLALGRKLLAPALIGSGIAWLTGALALAGWLSLDGPWAWAALALAPLSICAFVCLARAALRSTPRGRRLSRPLADAAGLLVLAGLALALVCWINGVAHQPLLAVFGAALALSLGGARGRLTSVVHHSALGLPMALVILGHSLASPSQGWWLPLVAPALLIVIDQSRLGGEPWLARAERAIPAAVVAQATGAGLWLMIGWSSGDVSAIGALGGVALASVMVRAFASQHRTFSTICQWTLTLAALVGPLAVGLLDLSPTSQAIGWSLLPLLMLQTERLPILRLERAVTRVIAGLIVVGWATVIAGVTIATWFGFGDTLTVPISHCVAIVAATAGAAWMLRPPASEARAHAGWTQAIAWSAALAVVTQLPLLSTLIGSERPAIEVALLAVLSARFTPGLRAPLAVLALLLTGGAYRSIVLPLTCTVLATLPLARGADRAVGIERAVHAAFVAAVAWLVCFVPSSGRSPWEILAPIAAIAGLFLLAAHHVGPRVSRGQAPQTIRRLRITLAAYATLALSLNLLTRFDAPAGDAVVLTAAFALFALLGPALWLARRGRPSGVDATLGVVALAHLFFALRTDWLVALHGHHLLAWAAAAPMLAVWGPLSELTVRLRRRALLMPLPALIATLPDHDTAAVATLLAAITWGLATRNRPGARRTFIGLGLLLVASWRLCMAMGVVDPAFYGLPAGATLVIGAHLERHRLRPRIADMLQWGGLIVADLSVAVQIIRLESPLHAALLFALGLGTVLWGWRRQRSDWMTLGAITVIVDVVLHLLRTGFARDFGGAALLVGAGALVLAVAAHHARRRAQRSSS